MKKFFLITVLSLVVNMGFSQSSFSILSYSLPKGWYANQSGGNTELVKKGAENSNCKIVFFRPVNIFIDAENMYEKYRNELLPNYGLEISSTTAVQKQSEQDWTSFSGLQKIGIKNTGYSIAFYSISDGSQTVFFAVYSTPDELCTNELDAIIESINLTGAGAGSSSNKAKARSKKVRIAALKSLKALVN